MIAALCAILSAGCMLTAPGHDSGHCSPPGPGHSAAQGTPGASPAPSCDLGLWAHVYHPDRLKVLEACKTVTGTVDAVRLEPDGDTHIRLAVADKSLVNAKNVAYQHGDLVLEGICQGPVTQADAVAACQGVPHDLVIPRVGDRVTVTGSWVLDQSHGWLEIHPVSSLLVLVP